METSREAARIAIEDTITQLKEIVPYIPLDAPITLHAITPYSQTMQTTFGREVLHRNAIHSVSLIDHLMSLSLQLWFAGLHAVHHWSMVRVSQIYSRFISGADFVATERFA
jgi:hypothetical protein